MAGRHATRFIIELKGFNGKWIRSGNTGLKGFFATREEATIALNTPGAQSVGSTYRVRQK
jgi:hypothetical protein